MTIYLSNLTSLRVEFTWWISYLKYGSLGEFLLRCMRSSRKSFIWNISFRTFGISKKLYWNEVIPKGTYYYVAYFSSLLLMSSEKSHLTHVRDCIKVNIWRRISTDCIHISEYKSKNALKSNVFNSSPITESIYQANKTKQLYIAVFLFLYLW